MRTEVPANATDAVLLHSAHEAEFTEGYAERLAWQGRGVECFDRPISAERLATITRVQLWAPHSDQIETLPEVIGSMSSLESLTISGEQSAHVGVHRGDRGQARSARPVRATYVSAEDAGPIHGADQPAPA